MKYLFGKLLTLFLSITKKPVFDKSVLRKNDIDILILDERWNSLFVNIEKTPDIIAFEVLLKELLKKEAKITIEKKNIELIKKKCMSKILELTPLVYDKHVEKAKEEMSECEVEIKRINKRFAEIEEELYKTEREIKHTNIELLEQAVLVVYFKIRKIQKRKDELTIHIEQLKDKLKHLIEEKEAIVEDSGEVYTYFHDLLGPEELERLDQKYIPLQNSKVSDSYH